MTVHGRGRFLLIAATSVLAGVAAVRTCSGASDAPVAVSPASVVVNIRDFGAIGDGRIHPVTELIVHGRFLKLRAVQKLYPFVDSLDWTVDEVAFERAKRALPPVGGTIHFPAGNYVTGKYPWKILRDNVRLTGDGPDRTILATAPRVSDALVVAPYRHEGWLEGADREFLFTEASGARGEDSLQLKLPVWSRDFEPGELVFIRSGANRFDQDYGEFNEIAGVTSTGSVRLKFPLSRDYTLSRVNWAGETATDFVLPGKGRAVVVALRTGEGFFTPPAKATVTIDENIFRVANSAPGRLRLADEGANAPRGTVIRAGSKLAKSRTIIKVTRTVRNFRCANLKIIGRRKVLNLSNTYDSAFTDCAFVREPAGSGFKGGLTIDGDGGRFAKFERCTITADPPAGMQFARSFGNVVFSDCTFKNTNVAFTEFNFDCEVSHCSFDVRGSSGLTSVIIAGKSCANLRFIDNRIHASGVSNILDTHSDIQSQKHGSEGEVIVRDNNIDAEGVAQIFPATKPQRMAIENNRVTRR